MSHKPAKPKPSAHFDPSVTTHLTVDEWEALQDEELAILVYEAKEELVTFLRGFPYEPVSGWPLISKRADARFFKAGRALALDLRRLKRLEHSPGRRKKEDSKLKKHLRTLTEDVFRKNRSVQPKDVLRRIRAQSGKKDSTIDTAEWRDKRGKLMTGYVHRGDKDPEVARSEYRMSESYVRNRVRDELVRLRKPPASA